MNDTQKLGTFFKNFAKIKKQTKQNPEKNALLCKFHFLKKKKTKVPCLIKKHFPCDHKN